MRSITARSSLLRSQLADCAFFSTCSGLVAPAITLATAGRASSQLNANSSTVCPCSFAKRSRRSTFSKLASFRYRSASPCFIASLDPFGAACPFRYLPVSKPLRALVFFEVALIQVPTRQSLFYRKSRPLRRSLSLPILAGQQATRQWEVGKLRHAVFLHHRQQLAFDVAHHEAVLILAGDKLRQLVVFGNAVRFDKLCGRQVGATNVTDLALPDEVVQRP